MKKILLTTILLVAGLIGLFYVADQFSNNSTPSQNASAESPTVAEPPFRPNAVAKSLTASPGAIVCPDFSTVQLVFKLYANHWEDTMQDSLTNGQAGVVRGKSAPEPNLNLYGCVLLVPGTPVHVENADAFTTGIPKVAAKLSDGKIFRGATLPGMLTRREE